MTEADVKEYEVQAREAERMAENSMNEKDRAAWLRIAAQWLRMIRPYRANETVELDQTRSTGEGSDSRN